MVLEIQALQLLKSMQKIRLEARAAACTAAIGACACESTTASTGEVQSWAVAMMFFQQMASWSVRSYDGTAAALARCQATRKRWREALTHLKVMREKGLTRLMRSYTATAEACESSLADWRLSAKLLETSEHFLEEESGNERFLLGTLCTKIRTYARSPCWNVALQAYHKSSYNNMGKSGMSVKAYNALMRAYSLQRASWNEVLALLDEMYREDLLPDTDTFDAAISACGAAQEWEWILQLYDELELNNLPPTGTTVALASQACGILGDEVRQAQLLQVPQMAALSPAST